MAVAERPSLCAAKSSPTLLPPAEQTLGHAASIQRQREASADPAQQMFSTWDQAAIGIWLLGRELAVL